MMKLTTVTIACMCASAFTTILGAQQASTSAAASATTQATVTAPANYSAAGRAKIDAAFQTARAKNLPEQPMRQRMAEGQAKSASETQVVTSVQKVEARLEASQAAMIHAGRANPQPAEVAAGEQAMERGASDAQIEAFAKHAPADRSLSVALNVLTKLEARGEPVSKALAEVQSKLDARASDQALVSLAGGVDGVAGLGSGASNAQGNNSNAAGASSNASGNAAAGVQAVGKGVVGATAGVTGAVSGVLGKKP